MLIALGFFTWVGVSGAVAWHFTHRRSPMHAEPLPVIAGLGAVEEHRLVTSDGEHLGAWLIRGEVGKPVIVFAHGIGGTREESTPLLKPLHDRGWTIVAVTLRGHGDSTGETIDFGYHNRLDVIAAVTFAREQAPKRSIIVFGSSLGAASALFAADGLKDDVAGFVLESPYKDLRTALLNRLGHHLNWPLKMVAYGGLRLWTTFLLDYDPQTVSPWAAAGRVPVKIPVAILSGARDRAATPAESEALYRQMRSHAKLVRFPTGDHGRLFQNDPELFLQTLDWVAAEAARSK